MKPLSKSNYTTGLKCPGHLWLEYHDKEKIPPHPLGVQRRFEQGRIVGQLAKKLFPQGIDIPEKPFTENLKKTKELLPKRKILFEAAVTIDNVYARADILLPVEKDEWDIIEVKSTTELKKKEHLPDIAFQKYVYEKAGLKIRKCFLMHLNKEFIKKGEIDVPQLLLREEVTEEVEKLLPDVPKNIAFLWKIVNSPTFPNTAEKNYCTIPKECLVKEHCWGFLPEHHVFHLYNHRKKMHLFEQGIHHLADVPEEALTQEQQKIQLKCAKTGKVHLDKQKMKEFLATIKEPTGYLDFETCSFAVPFFDGTRPYQRLPFQFSLHVIQKSKMQHFAYLHDGKDDPRPAFLKALKGALPAEGSVIVYSEGFEGSVLKELARDFPEYQKWVDDISLRFVDLRVPFSKFWYYNPVQKGKASIKNVLPAVTGKGYEGLNIADGDCASIAYLDMTFGEMSPEMKRKTREDLLRYCGRDTEGMVWVVQSNQSLRSRVEISRSLWGNSV